MMKDVTGTIRSQCDAIVEGNRARLQAELDQAKRERAPMAVRKALRRALESVKREQAEAIRWRARRAAR